MPNSRNQIGTPEPAGSKVWPALAVFGLCVVGRALLPFQDTDALLVHSRVVDSVLAGHNWGRQVLVGSLEYPLLPTLMLLTSRVALAPIADSAVVWLVSLCQVWTVSYLLRLSPDWRKRCYGIAAGAFCLLSPTVRNAVYALDPNWVLAVPMASTIYHLATWHRGRELRDAVLCSVNCGLLGFCGFGGIVFAVGLLWMMCQEVRQVSRVNPEEQSGVKLLIWTPFAYCAFLWLLWNWLVMGDMLFCLDRVVAAARAFTLKEALGTGADVLTHLPVILLGTAAVLGLTLGTPAAGIAACIAVGLAAIVVVRTLAVTVQLYPAGATIAAVTSCVGALMLPWMAGQAVGSGRQRLTFARLLIVPTVLLGLAFPGDSVIAEAEFSQDAPAPAEITEWIDRFWPNSRTAVYGIRLPSVYHDPTEKRFVARLDYHRDLFIEQAVKEQMHLLVPPPDGRYYAHRHTPLADIHRDGARWLFLEKEWPSKWQVWRCVIPPEGESKLRELR